MHDFFSGIQLLAIRKWLINDRDKPDLLQKKWNVYKYAYKLMFSQKNNEHEKQYFCKIYLM